MANISKGSCRCGRDRAPAEWRWASTSARGRGDVSTSPHTKRVQRGIALGRTHRLTWVCPIGRHTHGKVNENGIEDRALDSLPASAAPTAQGSSNGSACDGDRRLGRTDLRFLLLSSPLESGPHRSMSVQTRDTSVDTNPTINNRSSHGTTCPSHPQDGWKTSSNWAAGVPMATSRGARDARGTPSRARTSVGSVRTQPATEGSAARACLRGEAPCPGGDRWRWFESSLHSTTQPSGQGETHRAASRSERPCGWCVAESAHRF